MARDGIRYGLIVDSAEDSVDVYKSWMTVIPKVMNDNSNAEFRGDVSRIFEYARLDGKTETLMLYSVESFCKAGRGSGSRLVSIARASYFIS
ncbi:hypothetical protein [Pelagicoccus sp. SDUM812002]|uniref:hypothetical protein n=1 Tax=Pelagicoccus sp. SDUM812002 TaxID=3041266 RepID=UPI00280F288D|nr:hypothetical protein [Pelagicoccus sp. SDUM812002]MDQ8184441.1 hypothetical protein [Pelagicoccus sp. SDUM812002]